jgi:hypothetical protein
MDEAACFRIKSWDEVFRPPVEKGQSIEALRRKLKYASKIWHAVRARHAAGEAIGEALFEAVGRELGLGGSTVRDVYYKMKNKEPL